MEDKVRTLAFYLPQFHPIPENDLWWGKGFTEWTNVAEAKPAFPRHYQPHLPADLGFYDLRIPQIQEQQAELAQQYGIHGFCYYYYNFNGKKLLDLPLNNMLKSEKPDFPFCLCWANENWTRRWDGRDEEVLIKQEHTLESDENFIHDILPFLKDKRYIRVNNKLLLLIYRVEKIENPKSTAKKWREIVKNELGEELYLCTVNNFTKEIDPKEFGFDASIQFPLDFNPSCKYDSSEIEKKYSIESGKLKDYWFYNYDCIADTLIETKNSEYKFFRGAFPSWDNTARRHNSGAVFLNSSPGKYQNFLKKQIDLTKEEQSGDEQLVFINAWNEWAEGAHLEPDMKYGHAWLEATKNAIEGKEYLAPNLPETDQITSQEFPGNNNANLPSFDKDNPHLSKQNNGTSKKPKVLIVSYNYPRHDNSSGELRFSSTLELLSHYWDIDFGIINSHIGVNNQVKMKPYADLIQKLGIHLLPLKQNAIEEAISNKHYAGAFFNFYWVAESVLSRFIKFQPHAFTVVDSVDVHYARELSQASLNQLEMSEALQTKAKELAIYRTADITIAVSKEDFNLLKNKEKIKNTLMLPNIVPQFVRKEGIRKQIVNFIGNYAWPPNPDAVIWFASEVWPLIFSQCPQAEFQIIGSEATPEVLELSSVAGVNVLGYVPETKPYLEMAAVSVAPLRFGGGMKGKVNEALSHGLAVVATSFGAQGFNAVHGKDMFIADEASEFAKAVVLLLNDSALQEKVGLAGQVLNASISSPKAIHQKIEQLVEKCQQINKGKERKSLLRNIKLRLSYRKKILDDIGPGVQLLLNGGFKNFLHRGGWYLRGRKKLEEIPVKIPNHKFTVKKINRVVKFPPIDDPVVSIIIPVYNQWEYTIQCLDSIQRTSSNMKYEVILMDDQSSDETKNAEEHIKNARIIRNEKNLGFLLNCNKGASLAKGRYIIFLNNDTLVQDQWLFWLVYTMDFKHNVGLVG
ncbi:MAG: glycosyltransferase, partial [Bacteroidales bacterium]|nr:glycosyltransferase [Bacteroidales bacterium]